MLVIKYEIHQDEAIFLKEIPHNETNLAIAEKEAFEGKYTVEDNGQPEPEPTDKERLEALEMAMLEMLGVTSND